MRRTTGTIISAKKQWWLKINKKNSQQHRIDAYFGYQLQWAMGHYRNGEINSKRVQKWNTERERHFSRNNSGPSEHQRNTRS